jgi:penicillin-binding protein 2
MSNKISLYFRTAIIGLLLAVMCGAFVSLLYNTMIVNALDPKESAAPNTYSTKKTVNAARGDITDRYGQVLVTNTAQYVVTLDVGSMGEIEDQVQVIQRLLEICKEQDIEWNDTEFPVSTTTPFEYTTDGNPFLSQNESTGLYEQTRLYKLCEVIRTQKNADDSKSFWGDNSTSADALVDNMASYFQLSSSLSDKERREILGVLYSCYLREKEILWTDYYFAEDVNIDFITTVKQEQLPGVSVEAVSTREYKTHSAAHLLGQVGAITAEKWAELKENPDNDYNMNNIIGLSGVESAFEKYLRGIDGTQVTTYNNDGVVLDVSYSTEPQVGNNVALTLDINLQEAVEQALEDYTYKLNGKTGGSAAVVLSAKDSSILAIASYPTFDPATYSEDYEELSKDEMTPLYNRALFGTYAPGSTYKMCTATAAINAGVTDIYRTILCTGSITYLGHEFKCAKTSGHGNDNLSAAIRDSCNPYFYTIGAEMGIEQLTETSRAYGLGVATGIELSESLGVNAGPEYSESLGSTWYPGNTLSASIGQSDNRFTPLQLANYVATFVRGGDRYDAHLLKNVKTNDNSSIVLEHETQLLDTVELSDEARKAIITGMGQVLEADELHQFDELEANGIKIGCKTGTAQIGSTGEHNALFVAFAPIEDPEIVICTVVEKGGYGADSVDITADIMTYYFSDEATLQRVEGENQLLR